MTSASAPPVRSGHVMFCLCTWGGSCCCAIGGDFSVAVFARVDFWQSKSFANLDHRKSTFAISASRTFERFLETTEPAPPVTASQVVTSLCTWGEFWCCAVGGEITRVSKSPIFNRWFLHLLISAGPISSSFKPFTRNAWVAYE